MLQGLRIISPLGEPDLSADQEKALRRNIVKKALKLLQTEVKDQQIVRTE